MKNSVSLPQGGSRPDSSLATYDEFVSRLSKYKEKSPGHGKGCCPAHDDANPSLNVDLKDDGRILVVCRSGGCSFKDIVSAVGMETRGFSPPSNGRPLGPVVEQVAVYALEAVRSKCCPSGHTFAGEYLYEATDGVHALALRYEKGKEKAFRQASSRDGVMWIRKGPKAKTLPYKHGELEAVEQVLLVEGEKCVEALNEIDLTATTSMGGSPSPHKTDWSCLAGKDLFLLPDNDDPGRTYMDKVARLCRGAKSIRIVTLPDLPEKGDVVDFIAAVGQEAPALLAKLLYSAPKHEPLPEPAEAPEGGRLPGRRFTDTGNGERFLDIYGEDFRYVATWKRDLLFTGPRWKVDDKVRAFGMTKHVSAAIRDAAQHVAEDKRDAFEDHARRTEKVAARRALLESARAEEGAAITHEGLNRHPYLLNVQNGTLDLALDELKLRDHSRTDMLTQVAPVGWNPKADCPEFDKFIKSVMPDKELRGFLQRAVGYSLAGLTEEQVFLFNYGGGANGKTTLMGALQYALGDDYSYAAPSSLLMASHYTAHPTEIAALFARRFVVCEESGQQVSLDEAKVKALTGSNIQTGRRMREDFWSFTPTHTLWLCSNYKPKIVGTDDAIWRRVLLLPFEQQFKGKDAVRDMPARLQAEAEGILAWAVEGWRQYREAKGLAPPESVRVATESYRTEQDTFGRFLEECTEKAATSVPATEIRNRYERWFEESGDGAPLNKVEFSRTLQDRGFKRHKREGRQHYAGLRVVRS